MFSNKWNFSMAFLLLLATQSLANPLIKQKLEEIHEKDIEDISRAAENIKLNAEFAVEQQVQKVEDAAEDVARGIHTVSDKATGLIHKVTDAAAGAIHKVHDKASGAFHTVHDKASDIVIHAKDKVHQTTNKVSNVVYTATHKVTQAVMKPIKYVSGAIHEKVESIHEKVQDKLHKKKQPSFGTYHIPAHAIIIPATDINIQPDKNHHGSANVGAIVVAESDYGDIDFESYVGSLGKPVYVNNEHIPSHNLKSKPTFDFPTHGVPHDIDTNTFTPVEYSPYSIGSESHSVVFPKDDIVKFSGLNAVKSNIVDERLVTVPSINQEEANI